MCMKDVNANKLAVPRERGVPRTDDDRLGNVPPGLGRRKRPQRLPPPIRVFEVMMENAWLRGVTVL